MLKVFYVMLIAATLSKSDQLADWFPGAIVSVLRLVPDLAAGILVAMLLVHFAREQKLYLSVKYVAIGFLFILHLLLGIVLSGSHAGTVFSAIRDYLVFVPLFFLPAVVSIGRQDIVKLLSFAWLLVFLQVPVSIWQRFTLYGAYGAKTGDVIQGTLSSGAINSILIFWVLIALFAIWLKGGAKLKTMLWGGLLIIPPMFINETKGAVVLFIVSFGVMAFLSSTGKNRIKALAVTASASVLFVSVFAFTYDYFFPDQRGGKGFINFMLDRAIYNEFQNIKVPEDHFGNAIGRIDGLQLALTELSKNPAELVFGLGAGSVASPKRNEIVGGDHTDIYMRFDPTRTTFTFLLWEIGILGILFIVIISAMVFFDARKLAGEKGIVGAVGLFGSTLILSFPVYLLYKNFTHESLLIMLIMFFSGWIAAQNVRSQEIAQGRRSSGRVSPLMRSEERANASL